MKRICRQLKSDSDAYWVSARVLEAATDGSVDVIIKNHESERSLAQNALAFKWYSELDAQIANSDNQRNFCKWTYGFPVLLAREEVEPGIHRMWEILTTVPYEDRINAMEMVEVTRLFTTKEFTEYLRSIERYAADMGYQLSHPEDLYWEAMGATRKQPR